MIRIVTLIIILVILLIGILYFIKSTNTKKSSNSTLQSSNTNQINFPKKTDNLILGNTYILKWSGGGNSPINIFLVNKDAEKQGVSVSLFDRVYNIENTGSYKYTVPINIPTGEYKFEIGNLNSEYFKISR